MTNLSMYLFFLFHTLEKKSFGKKNCPGIFPRSVKHEQHPTVFVGERKKSS